MAICHLISISSRQLRSLLNDISVSFRGCLQCWPNPNLIGIRIYSRLFIIVLFNDYLLFFVTISFSSLAISRSTSSFFVSNFRRRCFLHVQTFVLNRNLGGSSWYWLRSQLILQFLFVLFGEAPPPWLRFGFPFPILFLGWLSPSFPLGSLFFVSSSQSFFL